MLPISVLMVGCFIRDYTTPTPILPPPKKKICMRGWFCEHITVVWVMNSTEADLKQKNGPQPCKTISPTRHQNEADRLLTVGRTFAGAFIILYVPCRFCFAWPEFWKVLFSYFTPHHPIHLHGQEKERSSVYMLKLHLFYSQLYKSCETNCS